jgi:alkylation response protein AidB-like acyl-CoA dehydrogenase
VNFGFDEGQQALREAAHTLLAAECDSSVVRRALEDPDAWRPLWNTIVELGWTSLGLPEEFGGLGLGVVDLVGLAEVTGRWALPVPFLTTVGCGRCGGHWRCALGRLDVVRHRPPGRRCRPR